MTCIKDTFGCSKVLLPVIHVDSPEQAVRNAELCSEAGADGVFVINQGSSLETVGHAIEGIDSNLGRDFWIGINRLGYRPTKVFENLHPLVSGVWSDNSGISDVPNIEVENLLGFSEFLDKGLYFGGFAFKYQEQPKNLALAAERAGSYIRVPTTSGTGTGISADINKIKIIRSAMWPSTPLAIASGITPSNVGEYLPYVDAFLVATGISDSFNELNLDKTTELAEKIHA